MFFVLKDPPTGLLHQDLLILVILWIQRQNQIIGLMRIDFGTKTIETMKLNVLKSICYKVLFFLSMLSASDIFYQWSTIR